jgi:NAD(P)-dependent dehydrogenase (short-subunit alcohol dehydrogenase family)
VATIHIWVNNAGMFDDTPWQLAKSAGIALSRNYKSMFFCAQAAAPICWLKDGDDYQLASMAPKWPFQGTFHCSSSCRRGVKPCLAAELGLYGITVNAICPGPIDPLEMLKRPKPADAYRVTLTNGIGVS